MLVKTAVVQAWGAADQGEAPGQNVRMAGQTLARAIAILVRLILTGIVAWLTKKGIDKAPELIAELKASKLGAGFAEWVEKNLGKLMNDPKLRGHKQGQGSAAKAVESEAQTPSQLAKRPVEEAPPPPPKSLVNQEHIAELQSKGTKFTPENVVATGKKADGQVVFLETGNSRAGLQHIVESHGDDFARAGISEGQIPGAVTKAVSEGNVVGYQGAGTGRPIYQTVVNGQPINIAVTTGSNGFIVGANPAGRVP